MNCEEVRLSLEEREDAARLPEPARAHLSSCPDCSEYAKLFEPGGEALREALSMPPDPKAFARVKAGVAKRLDRRRERVQAPSFWTPLRIGVAAAAGVAIAAGAYFLPNDSKPKREPEVAKENPPDRGPQPGAARERLAKLQESVQKKYLLEELANLQGALQETANADAKSLAQDAELYVERLLALKAMDPPLAREILDGIRSAQIARRLGDARKKLGPDAGESLTRPLDMAAEALAEAEEIAELDGGCDAN